MHMIKLLIVLFLGLNLSALAQDISSDENKYLGYIYQQASYKLDDPQGDVLLLWSAKQVPESIIKNLTGKSKELSRQRDEKIQELLFKYPQYQPKPETKNVIIETYVPFDTSDLEIELEGHEAPFKSKNMILMLKQIITEEHQLSGMIPVTGNVHEWSPEIKKEIRKKFPVFSRFSKLLIALSRGVTSYFMLSGTEEALQDYIISRPENSINLEEMFRAAYRINKGDVYLSLLTIENVLSRFWITPQRSNRLVTTKLKDITNYYYHTDKFGSWYHLFGIMLYGYAHGSLKAKIVGNLESAGSHILGRFQDEKQEDYINGRGGVIGARLHRFIKNNEFQTFALDKKYIEEDFYMDLDEDFTKRIEKAQKKGIIKER